MRIAGAAERDTPRTAPPILTAPPPEEGCDVRRASVGLFVDSFTPIVDGVTVTVRNYAFWLSRLLGPACVVTPRVPGHVDEESYPVIRYLSVPTLVRPPYRVGLPTLDPGLRAALRGCDFSIIHAHSPFGAGHEALRVGRERGIPVVATFHSKFRENLTRSVPIRRIVDDGIRRIVDFLFSVDQVWIPQESVAPTLRDYGYNGPYQVVENGTDFAPLKDTTRHREWGGRCLGVPDEAPVGLFVGQLVLEKNLEFLLETLPDVMEKVPGFRMVFVGQGYAEHRLKKVSRSLGIEDRVMFHDMVFDREVLRAIYARGDLLLFPSLYDNAPLALRESAAMGTPALLVRGASSAEVIRDNGNGFLAENDPREFARRIVEVVRDRGLREAAGREAQRTLCRSWQSVAREIRERYLGILRMRDQQAPGGTSRQCDAFRRTPRNRPLEDRPAPAKRHRTQ
jgi:1,2-diacylglycerol 3-alpha-glucosyltransferase